MWVGIALSVLGAGPGEAAPAGTPATRPSRLWSDVVFPERGTTAALLARARALLARRHASPTALRRARAQIRRALAASPRGPAAWFLFGQISARLGAFAEAAKAFARVAQLDPTYRPRQTRLERAMALWHLGAWVPAARILHRLPRAADPNAVKARLLANAGEAFLAAGHLRDAERTLRAAVAVAPRYPTPRWTLAVLYHRREQFIRARRLARLALALDPKATALRGPAALYAVPSDRLYYEALVAEAQRAFGRAARLWRRYLRTAPRSPWAPVVRRGLSRLPPPAAARSAARAPSASRARVRHPRGP